MPRFSSRKALLASFLLGALAVIWWAVFLRTHLVPGNSQAVARPAQTPSAPLAPTAAGISPTASPASAHAAISPAPPAVARLLALDVEAETFRSSTTVADRWPRARTLLSDEFASPAAASLRHRVRIVRTDFKYPLLRIEELSQTDPVSGTERLLAQTAMVADHLVAKPAPGVDDATFRAAVASAGGSIRSRKPASGVYLVAFPPDALDALPAAIADLQSIPGLLRIAEPDYIVHASLTPTDPGYSLLWGLHNTGHTGGLADADIDAPEAWDISVGSRSVLVGVIDTGIDHTHPDLAANMWINPGEIAGNGIDDDANGYVDDTRGWDFLNNDNNPVDNDLYHGTHVAGTIGGTGGNSLGVVGVAHEVSLVALKTLGPDGGANSDAIEAVAYSTALGVDLTSNSWTGSGFSQALSDVITAAGATGKLFVAAAGNDSRNTDLTPDYPASFPLANIVSVAATDHADTLASFSNYGATSVDLGAPGANIYSTSPGSAYRTLSGTSMAAPHVAGAAAVILAHAGPLSPASLKALLLDHGDSLPALAGRTVSGKRLNLAASLAATGPADPLSIASVGVTTFAGTIGGLFTPASTTFRLTNNGTAPLFWSASQDAAWLSLSPAFGTLAAGASADVVATPTVLTATLPVGHHTAALTFTNRTTSVTRTRAVGIAIASLTETVFSEDFETGALNPARWTVTGTGAYRTRVTTLHAPRSGAHHLTLDTADTSLSYARNEATVALDLSGRSRLTLSFWARISGDEPEAPPSNPFVGGANFDGLAVSVDGVTWHEIQALRTPVVGDVWQKFALDLDAVFAARGLAYGSSVRFRFNQYDDYQMPLDGIAIDDIALERVYTRSLVLNAPASISENASPASATLTATPAPTTSLVVSLASSASASLSVPATVTIPAGQSSVTFALTPSDDSLLNGSRPVAITASATTWGDGAAIVRVNDNESVTLSLSLPASVREGDSPVNATLTAGSAPATDAVVSLTVNLPAEAFVPFSVVLPAGQTSVSFPVSITDDTRVDGPVTVVLTASVPGWVSGQASFIVSDNESSALALTIPADLREGQAASPVFVSVPGALVAPLTVALSLDDSTELSLPGSVTIPAGQNRVAIPLTVLDDTDTDGPQTVRLLATAPGFPAISADLVIADNDPHHLTLSPIASPRIRGASFPVSLSVCDISGAIIPGYTGTVALSATDSTGASVPVATGTGAGFVQGIWSGPVTVSAFAAGVRLTFTDAGGRAVTSNAFDVGTGSFHRLAWDPISSPQKIDTPFTATVHAVDVAGNPVRGVSAPLGLVCKSGAETVEILSWTRYVEPGPNAEYPNTKAAIATHFTAFRETSTDATTAAALEAALVGKHVFLIPEQETATPDVLGAQGVIFAPVLQAFVARGGIVIACSYATDEHLLLSSAGLLSAARSGFSASAQVTKSAETVLNAGVATPLSGVYIGAYTAPEDCVVSLHLASNGAAVVLSRSIGPGRVILIGTDFNTLGTGMDRVIANAVASAAGAGGASLPVRSAPAALVDGAWTGAIAIPFEAGSANLVATTPSGDTGASSPFGVVVATPPAGDASGADLTLSLPAQAAEGASGLSGAVSVSVAPTSDLSVALAAYPSAKIILPASVVIPSGQTSASFTFSCPDDALLDGPRLIAVVADAPGRADARDDLLLTDNDTTTLVLSGPATIAENAGPTRFIATLGSPVLGGITLNLASSASGSLSVPATLPIPVGATQADFHATPADDFLVNGARSFTLSASVPGWPAASLPVQISDNETGAFSLSPTVIDITLPTSGTGTRTLALANGGASPINWTVSVGMPDGPAANGSVAASTGTPLPLETILANLNVAHGSVRTAIPSRYAFTEGVAGDSIVDGGGDMYDGGNLMSTDSGDYLDYSDNAIISAPSSLGSGGRYFTRKLDGLFVFAADISTRSSFSIYGNLGANSSGSTDIAVLTQARGSVTYKGFVKRVYGAGDPSVNHLIIVADNGSVTHSTSTNTDEDYHRVSNLSGVTRIYYLLYAGTSGAYIDNTATAAIFSAFLDAVGMPDFVKASPSSGTLAASAAQNVPVSFDAAGLVPGVYRRELHLRSNAAGQPLVAIPVSLTVQDRVLHHLEFDPLPASLVRGASETVRLRAVDAAGLPVVTFNRPLTLVANGTTLAAPVVASDWINGIWTGRITPGAFAESATLSVSDAGISGISSAFAVSTGPLVGLGWSNVPSPQAADTPFSVTLQAQDAGGNRIDAFNGTAALSAILPHTHPQIGTNYNTRTLPFGAISGPVLRQQSLYPASLLGGARRLVGLGLNVSSLGAATTFNQWTIRLKHSSRTSLSDGLFDNTGWTTVHSSNALVSSAGWITFPFSTAFDYDGSSALLVDLSYRGTSAANSIYAHHAYDGTSRTILSYGSDTSADPAGFVSGTAGYYPPILRFASQWSVAVRPASVTLVNGAWSGPVSLSAPGESMQLRASSASPLARGDSNLFTTTPAAPPPAVPYAEGFESGVLSHHWTFTGTNYHRSLIRTDLSPRTGTSHLILDSTSSYDYSRNEATITLDLADRTEVVLSFWAKGRGNGSNAPRTNPFTGGADFDGVAISPDGVTWYEVQPLRSPALTSSWKQFTVDLDAAIAACGWSYTGSFRIRFNRYGYGIAPDAAIAIDDILLTAASLAAPTLSLPASALESAAPVSGTLSIATPAASDLVFTLSSSAPAKLALPATVTLPAGQTSVGFTATPIDDALLEGFRPVVVAALPPADSGLFRGSTTLRIDDDETTTFALSVSPAIVAENSTAATATLTLGAPPDGPLPVALSSSDPTAATVPAIVYVEAGQTTATFSVTPVEDIKLDGPQITTITATAGSASVGAAFIVTDNEIVSLSISSAGATEGVPGTGQVMIGGTLPTPLTVGLVSANPAQLTVPASVIIPAGSRSASFTVTAVDDSATDGTIGVPVTASANGFAPSTRSLNAIDDEFHHFSIQAQPSSPHLANSPFPVQVYARTIDNTPAPFSGGLALSAVAGSTSVPLSLSTIPFAGSQWSGQVSVNATANGVTLRVDDGAGHTAVSGSFNVVIGPLDRFAFSMIDSPRTAASPFGVTITAVDAAGNRVSSFNGAAALSAVGSQRTIGTGSYGDIHPLNGIQARAQTIYLASELGGPGRFSELALQLNTPPGAAAANFTIRVKTTSRSSYPYPGVWEATGWTTVYQGSPLIPAAGWCHFRFSTPFVYDGASNLLVDFSHSGTTSLEGRPRCFSATSTRTLYRSLSGEPSPLDWSGSFPQPYPSSYVPNLRLSLDHDTISISPAMTGSFVNGVWTGDLTPSAAGLNIAVHALSGTTSGISNTFEVAAAPAADSDTDGLPDAWETAHGLDPASSSATHGRLGDPDGDGLPNLLEYAFGLDPLASDANPCTSASAIHPDTGAQHLTFTYRRLIAPGSVNYAVQTSTNLQDWAPPADAPELLSVAPNADGITETVSVRINPALGSAPVFVRLEVSTL
jgi:subtilisin family serine protease